jgi:hypothetical protein
MRNTDELLVVDPTEVDPLLPVGVAPDHCTSSARLGHILIFQIEAFHSLS